MLQASPDSSHPIRSPYRILCAAVLLYFVTLLIYSQTFAFTGDEGFHLLTARLIQMGERPYLDFFFPQAPFNAYVNSGWMAIFGVSWRPVHVLDALLVTAAVFLIADFVFARFPVPAWRLPAAIAAILAMGFNAEVVAYGPLAQAYGMCLFTTAAAFRLSTVAVRRTAVGWAALAGLFAGIATSSSLLTASVAPILLLWILFYNETGSRWIKSAALVVGAALPFAPVLWLATQGPRQVWFNLFQYHLQFRKLYWPETTQHDLEVLVSWIDAGQALLLILLACGGVWFVMFARDGADAAEFKSEDEPFTRLKRELYLCVWLTLGIGFEVSLAHPTLPRYFVLTVPFIAILSCVGLYVLGSNLRMRPLVAVLLFAMLSVIGLGKSLYERNQDLRTWADYQHIADAVEHVTPRDVPLYANELIYFLTRRPPPPGMEFSYSHKVDLPPADLALFHIVTESELNRRLRAGTFPTAVACDDDQEEQIQTDKIYSNKKEIGDCTVFWGLQVRPTGK